ncbi:MAG TPA: hypothetical protein VIC59_04275 [Gemmatimonadota bacterium]
MRRREPAVWILSMATAILVAAPALAQEVTVQPAKGQNPELMQKDTGECQAAATKSTGYTPAPPAAPAKPEVGARARGAAAGAAAGAVGAEVRGEQYAGYDAVSDEAKDEYRKNEAQEGAAAGAAAAGARQRQKRRQGHREEAAQESAAAAYDKAYQGCLEARGYTVTQPSPPASAQQPAPTSP